MIAALIADAHEDVATLARVTQFIALVTAVGIALPFALRLARRGPQVASGPITLASADLVTWSSASTWAAGCCFDPRLWVNPILSTSTTLLRAAGGPTKTE
jgi:hypothetical protein